jgi:hypothetical protein
MALFVSGIHARVLCGDGNHDKKKQRVRRGMQGKIKETMN